MKTRISAAALADIRKIAAWIGRDRPMAARKMSIELRRACLALADTHEAFARAEDLLDGQFRRRVVSRYSIYYRVVRNEVVVVRILDSARHITSLL